MKVVLSTWGKFHFFHLARQLEKRGVLEKIFSTYPSFKLKNEGLPRGKVQSDAVIETFLLGKGRYGIATPFDRSLQHLKVDLHDRHMLKLLPECDVFVALSGSGQVVGDVVQKRGGAYICERGSSHIAYGDDLMVDEFARWGAETTRTSERFVAREEIEYAQADRVVVPSSFAKRSFVERSVPADKIVINGYGADLSRFNQVGKPPTHQFIVLFVGGIRFRKGIPYLLEAFRALRHPNKVLKLAGPVLPEIRAYLENAPLENVEFLNSVPNAELPKLMSEAHVMVLPSVEEGQALVQAEALACGCPVIATCNTGGEDLFSDGVEGFIVPIRDPQSITDRLQQLIDDPDLRERMSQAGMANIRRLGGWDRYGGNYMTIFEGLKGRPA